MQCGGCTLCCLVLPVPSLNKKAGVQCDHCKNGCEIYGIRPAECRQFQCAYYQMEKVSGYLRPDFCKIIFEKISDNVFFGTVHPDYKLTQAAKKQIVAFGKQGFSTIVKLSEGKPLLFLSEGHTPEQVYKEFKEYLKNDCS